MSQQNAAYDLSVFENRTPEARKPRIKVREGGKTQQVQHRVQMTINAAVGVVLVALACALIYSQVTITELTGEMMHTEEQLTAARSEYDYLASELDRKTSVKNVEEIAETQLGLVKMDKSQISYITLEEESVITVPQSGLRQRLDQLQQHLLSIIDQLGP